MRKDDKFFFVNKSALDNSLSHSEDQEGLGIRRFIQQGNRRRERVRREKSSTSHSEERLSLYRPTRTVQSNDETHAEYQCTDLSVCKDQVEHRKCSEGVFQQTVNDHSQISRRPTPPSRPDEHHSANEKWQEKISFYRTLRERGSWSSIEHRGSEYFLGVIAADFTSKECLIFWNGLLPCILNEDVGIRLLVSAFAFMHEFCSVRDQDTHLVQSCYKEALRCCNKAIKYVRDNADTMTKTSLTITCVLIVSIEILRGNLETAKAFLDTSLTMSGISRAELVEGRWKQPVSPNSPTSFERAIEVTQAKMTGTFYVFGTTSEGNQCREKYHPIMPHTNSQLAFSNLEDVNTLAEMLYSSTLRTAESLETQPEVNRGSASASTMQVGFERFHRGLQSIRARGSDQQSTSDVFTRTMIQEVKVLEAEIVFNCVVLGDDEMAFDSWNLAFEKIVSGITYKLERSTSDPQRLTYHPFSAVFIAPLWLVASRCRDPDIRRRAIRLLCLYRRRETVHDSLIAAKVAQRIVALEERSGTHIVRCSDINRSCRVRLIAAEYLPTCQCVQLEYVQGCAAYSKAETIIREQVPCDVICEWWIKDEAISINALLQPLLLYSKVRRNSA